MRRSQFLRAFRTWKPSGKLAAHGFGLVLLALLFSVVEAVARPAEPSQGSNSVSAAPPFDLVWDDVDANSLPLNPSWRSMKYGHVLPDFRESCGPAFKDGGYDRIVNYGLLASKCSSQSPTTDFPPQLIPCDFSTDKVLAGHLNWAITTQVGTIFWSGYDNFDGDFNLELKQPDRRAETVMNDDTEYGIHLEFKGNEVLGNFGTPFWVAFYQNAINSHSEVVNTEFKRFIEGNEGEGKPAVVTGLLGIDGVHGGYTESHPIFSLAIRADLLSVRGGVDAHWAFFLRNQGSEGCCSNHLHQWDGLIDPHGGWHWYFIQLPVPTEIPAGVRVTVSADQPATQLWANVPLTGPVITQDAQWVYLGFRLPEPAIAPELDGEILLHYVFQNSSQNSKPLLTISRPRLPVARARMVSRGDDWEGMRKRIQPADLPKLDAAIQASQVASVKPRPHTIRLTVPSSPVIALHQPLIGPGNRGQLTRAKAVVDPAGDAARAQLDQKLQPIIPKDILQHRP